MSAAFACACAYFALHGPVLPPPGCKEACPPCPLPDATFRHLPCPASRLLLAKPCAPPACRLRKNVLAQNMRTVAKINQANFVSRSAVALSAVLLLLGTSRQKPPSLETCVLAQLPPLFGCRKQELSGMQASTSMSTCECDASWHMMGAGHMPPGLHLGLKESAKLRSLAGCVFRPLS